MEVSQEELENTYIAAINFEEWLKEVIRLYKEQDNTERVYCYTEALKYFKEFREAEYVTVEEYKKS